MKRFLLAVTMVLTALYLAVIPAHASGFSSANIIGGGSQVRGEFKGSHGGSSDTYYSRTHSGTGASRVITETMKKSWSKQYALMESGIADPLSDTDYESVHFAHARIMIALKKVGNENVVLRLFPVLSDWTKEGDAYKTSSIFNLVYSNEYSTYGWMSTYGGYEKGITEHDQCHIYTSSDPDNRTVDMYEGRNFLKWGTDDTPIYQTFDFIFDCYKGYVYGYIDGRLIATKINATHFDNFYGYTITGTADESGFANGTKLWFKYDTERPGETLYVDTDDYTVRLEDVLADAGLADNNGDPHQIMESDHVADYIFAGDTDYNYYDTYERRDSNGDTLSITAEKLKTSSGNVAQLYGGCYYKGKDWPGYAYGKGVIHVSFDQKINKKLNSGSNAASSNYTCKVLSQDNTAYNLFYMQPVGDNKMQVTLEKQQGNSNPKVTLDKDFNGTIHYDVILYGKHYTTDPVTTQSQAMGYYFADGQYIGSYKINRGSDASTAGTDTWWTPTQLLLYSDNTANVTYSNYKIAVYDENKNAEDIVAELDGSALSLTDIELTEGEGAYADCFTVSGRISGNSNNIPANAKAYICVYDTNNKLLDCDMTVCSNSGIITSKRFRQSYNGTAPSCSKIFFWDGMSPITTKGEILHRIDPLTYATEVSYDNGMSWYKLNYTADHSGVTEYSYPVENREILQGTIRDRDNIFIKITNGSYCGSVINIEDCVFDTVTLTKGENKIGYAFLAAKPESYILSPKFKKGYTPSYAAGYTRVIYTEDQEVTLHIPDNARYLYVYNNSLDEINVPSAITFSKSGTATQNSGVRIATWNIGHFSLGVNSYSTIAASDYAEKRAEYEDYINNVINADVISLNEYSEYFIRDSIRARDSIFSSYPTRYEGEQRSYSCNAIYGKTGFLSNMTAHNFACYTAAGGSGSVNPTNYYYITSDLNVNGQTVKLVSVHLYYTDNPQTLAVQAINELINTFSNDERVILMGDWNSTYDKFEIFANAGYSLANTDGLLATYSECQDSKYDTDIVDGYGSYDNIIYKGVNVSDFGLAGCKLSDHYGIYCTVTVD